MHDHCQTSSAGILFPKRISDSALAVVGIRRQEASDDDFDSIGGSVVKYDWYCPECGKEEPEGPGACGSCGADLCRIKPERDTESQKQSKSED